MVQLFDEYRESENIQRMELPAMLLTLIPSKNYKTPLDGTIDELKMQECVQLPQELIRIQVNSMKR